MKKYDGLKYNEDDDRTLSEDILDFVKVFAITAIVVLIFINFIAHPVKVVGRSMDPTLADGEFGFTSIISTYVGEIERGDVVVIKMNDEETGKKSHWVKRVIGLPGDEVSCKEDVIYVNGEVLDESSYINQEYKQSMIDQYGYFNGVVENGVLSDFDTVKLGEDEYFLLGDNRPYSKDSRDKSVGPVSKEKLFGKGVLVLLPISKVGFN